MFPSSKLVPRTNKQILFCLLLFVSAQAVVLYFFVNNFSFSGQKIGEEKFFGSTKTKFVDFPPNYEPPCQIKAKEALSALNRFFNLSLMGSLIRYFSFFLFPCLQFINFYNGKSETGRKKVECALFYFTLL